MDIKVPAYYVLNRKIDREHVGPILRALNITPVFSALISDVNDAALGLMFSPQVMRCTTEAASCEVALAMSAENNMPILVLGTADVLDAVYRDGSRHAVAASA